MRCAATSAEVDTTQARLSAPPLSAGVSATVRAVGGVGGMLSRGTPEASMLLADSLTPLNVRMT